MKKIIKLSLCLFLIMGIGTVINVHAADDIIKNDQTGIPDKMLYRLLLEECDKNKDKQLSTSELQSITVLFSNGYGITNLQGINLLTNLERLFIEKEHVDKIAPISGMTNLEYLNLTGSSVSDLSGFKNLPNLMKLKLGNNKITDISALQGFPNLRELELHKNNISNLAPLKNLTNLTKLTLSNNEITDLSPIANLTKLTELTANNNNNISNISALRNLTSLTKLEMSYNNIGDISALAGMNKLRRLNLESNRIADIDCLKNMNELEYLKLGYNQLEDITAIKELIYLETLTVNHNKLTKIPDLTLLRSLTGYTYNPIYDDGTWFGGNRLTEKELRNKMPQQLANYSTWINRNKFTMPVVKNLREVGISSNSVKLMWDKCDDAMYYEIYQSEKYPSDFHKIATLKASSLTYEVKSLLPYTDYEYMIKAYTVINGEKVLSSDSSSISVRTIIERPQNVKVTPKTATSLKISWDSVGADRYRVYRSTSKNGKYVLLGECDYNENSMISKGLQTGQTYYYKVRAYENFWSDSRYSEFSQIVSGTPKLTAPKNVKASANTSISLKISWDKVDGGTYYQVYRSTSKDGKYALLGVYDNKTASSISRSLATGKTYYYKVRTYRWVNGQRVFSPFSTPITGKPVLQKSSYVSASPISNTTAKITWNKIEGATYYQVYRGTSPNGKYVLLGVYDNKTSSSVSRSLKKGQTYYYKVRGYKWVNGQRVFSPFSTPVKMIMK